MDNKWDRREKIICLFLSDLCNTCFRTLWTPVHFRCKEKRLVYLYNFCRSQRLEELCCSPCIIDWLMLYSLCRLCWIYLWQQPELHNRSVKCESELFISFFPSLGLCLSFMPLCLFVDLACNDMCMQHATPSPHRKKVKHMLPFQKLTVP